MPGTRLIRSDLKAAAVCLLLVVFSICCFWKEYNSLAAIAIVLAAAIFVITSFLFEKQQLFAAMIFAVPFSVGTEILSGSEIQFPTEPLIGIFILAFFIQRQGARSLANDLFASPLSVLLLVSVCWLIISSLTSQLPAVSFKFSFIRICYIAVFFFVALQWMRFTGKPQQLYLLSAAGMIIPIIRGMIFHARFDFSHQAAYQMPKPFFNDHTVYGACIAFIIPVITCCVIARKHIGLSNGMMLLLSLLLLFLVVAEFLSYSRAAWLSMICAGGLALLLWWRITPLQMFLLLLLAGGTIYFLKDDLFNRFEDRKAVSTQGDLTEHVRSIANIETDASNKERINRWKCAVRMGDERPLFGFGPRTYKFIYSQYQVKEDMTYTSTFNGNKGHAHSEYLSAYAEEGVPGFIIQCALFLGTLLFGVGTVRNCKWPGERMIAAGALLGFFTYFIHGFFNSFTEDDKMASLVFMAMATLVYVHERSKMEQKEMGERMGQKTA